MLPETDLLLLPFLEQLDIEA